MHIFNKHIFEGLFLKEYIEKRAIDIANYIIEHNATVRETAKITKVGKTTTHLDLTTRLEEINPKLHKQVEEMLQTFTL